MSDRIFLVGPMATTCLPLVAPVPGFAWQAEALSAPAALAGLAAGPVEAVILDPSVAVWLPQIRPVARKAPIVQIDPAGRWHLPGQPPVPVAPPSEMLLGMLEGWLVETRLDVLRRFGADDFLRDMFDLCFEYLPAQLQRAADATDPSEIAKALHTIKSSAGNFGLRAVQRLCDEGERLASATPPDPAARTLVVDARTAYERTVTYLQAARARITG